VLGFARCHLSSDQLTRSARWSPVLGAARQQAAVRFWVDPLGAGRASRNADGTRRLDVMVLCGRSLYPVVFVAERELPVASAGVRRLFGDRDPVGVRDR